MLDYIKIDCYCIDARISSSRYYLKKKHCNLIHIDKVDNLFRVEAKAIRSCGVTKEFCTFLLTARDYTHAQILTDQFKRLIKRKVLLSVWSSDYCSSEREIQIHNPIISISGEKWCYARKQAEYSKNNIISFDKTEFLKVKGD